MVVPHGIAATDSISMILRTNAARRRCPCFRR